MSATLPRWGTVSALSAAAAAIAIFGGLHGPVRSIIVVWFLLVCPGMSFVRLLGIGELATELMLAVALSIAIGIIVPGTLLYAHLWSPEAAFVIVTAMTLSANVVEAVRTQRRVPAAEAGGT